MPAGAFADLAAARADAARQLAMEILTPRYPVAAHDRDVAAYLASAPVAASLDSLISASIAADHFVAQARCPGRWLRRIRGGSWTRYVERRAADAVAVCARLLADWCIWRCIPEQWLPRELVFAGVKERMRRSGLEILEMTGSLRPPVPGGEPGLRLSCAIDRAALPGRCALGPVVAVLYRETGPEIAVLDSSAVDLPEFALGPLLISPPRSIGVKLLGVIGLDRWWWQATRPRPRSGRTEQRR
jgi:hypothetical protein